MEKCGLKLGKRKDPLVAVLKKIVGINIILYNYRWMTLQRFSFFSLLVFWSAQLFAVPVVNSVDPFFGPSAGGNPVTITGSGFTGATAVTFGILNNASFIVIDDNTLQAVAPITAPGAIDVQVTAPSGTSVQNPPFDYYTYQGVWYAYAPDFGSSNVYPIDVATQTLLPMIVVQSEPNDVVLTPNGKLAVVTNSGSNSISVIDVATQSVLGNFSVGVGFPIQGAIAPTPDGKKAAIVGYSSNSVVVFDLTTFTMSPSITVGTNPSCIAILPNGLYGYVTNSGSGLSSKIDLTTFIATTIPLPLGVTPSFISVTPNGQTAVITDDASNSVIVFDLTTNTIVATITWIRFD